MKKFLISTLFVLRLFGFATAQQAAVSSSSTVSTTDKKAGHTKTVHSKTDKTVAKSSGLKADGTPDMRMKVNKDSAKTTVSGPAKKNGTPDMRYKSNKKK